jgi:hypothetical protein
LASLASPSLAYTAGRETARRRTTLSLEQQVNGNIATGMSPSEARRQANLEFGGLERFKEECREVRWKHRLDVLIRDH